MSTATVFSTRLCGADSKTIKERKPRLSRIDPWSLFEYVYPKVKDELTGRYFCRACGRLVPKRPGFRRKYICSDRCETLMLHSLSWPYARQLAWKRDGGKCVKCGEPLKLTSGDSNPGVQVAEIHHVVSAEEIRQYAREYALGFGEKGSWEYNTRFARYYAFGFLLVDNLQTLCPMPCHEEEEKKRRKAVWRKDNPDITSFFNDNSA